MIIIRSEIRHRKIAVVAYDSGRRNEWTGVRPRKISYNIGMKQFLKFFVLEFVIIFVIGSLGYWFFEVPFNLNQQLLSSATAAAVLAYALVWSQSRR